MESKEQTKIFVETLALTRDFNESLRASGITEKIMGKALFSKYKNVYKAVFETLGLTEEDVLKEFISLIKEPIEDEVRIESASGTIIKRIDESTKFQLKRLKLQATELFMKIM